MKSGKNPKNVKDENRKIVDNNYDVDVQVQNLFEVNLMFNKAGCGLPLDEVALISMSMNEMARLNKFKKIRYLIISVERIDNYTVYLRITITICLPTT